MSWIDDKGLGPAPWKYTGSQGPEQWNFSKQIAKRGYINNPYWTNDPASLNKHNPCGYWFDSPSTTVLVPITYGRAYLFHSVAVDYANGVIYISAVSSSGRIIIAANLDMYVLSYGQNTEIGAASNIYAMSVLCNNGVAYCIGTNDVVFDGVYWLRDASAFKLVGLTLSKNIIRQDTPGGPYSRIYYPYFERRLTIDNSGNLFCAYGTIDDGAYYIWCSRSLNGGSTWTQIYVAFGYSFIGDYPINIEHDLSNNLYIFHNLYKSGAGIVKLKFEKSIDGGLTWSTHVVTNPSQISTGHLTSCVSGNRLYVATSEKTFTGSSNYMAYLHYSDDGGSTWTSNPIFETWDYTMYSVIAAYGSTVVYIPCFYDKTTHVRKKEIWRTTNAGASWVKIGVLYPYVDSNYPTFYEPNPLYKHVTLAADGPMFAFTTCGASIAGSSQLAVLLSLDAGATWTVKGLPIANDALYEALMIQSG